jgi:hypothetical protein
LIVCWLRELGAPEGDWRTMKVEDARRWIADRRPSGEPWQRDDPVLARTSDSERPLAAIGIPDSGPLAAALVYAPGTSGTSIMQMVARDGSAAAEGLRAAATAARSPIVLVNFPDDEPIAAGLTALGIRPDHVQLEMQLRLADD